MTGIKQLADNLIDSLKNEMQSPFETVGRWHRQLGRIALAMTQAADDSYPLGYETLSIDLEFNLSRMVEDAALLLAWFDIEDPAVEMVREYVRAAEKHPGMTLDSDNHTNESRYYALAEEVGEVAAALTYDNEDVTGHNADIIKEAIQVGGLALAWLMRYQKGGDSNE